jgi:acyl-CoA reductase-like NAD-dependent aldehyde dehydrogenase
MAVETINPATGKVEYTLELMDAAAIEAILAASKAAFPAWSSRPLQERGELLRKVGAQLRLRRADIQNIMTVEMGKLRKEALAEIDKCADAAGVPFPRSRADGGQRGRAQARQQRAALRRRHRRGIARCGYPAWRVRRTAYRQ